MNRHYVYDEETPMTTQRDSNWLAAAGLLLLLVIGALAMLFVTYKAVAQSQPRTATITFTAPTTRTDGTNITGALSYELYQGLKGAAKVKVSTFTGSATTVSTGLVGGSEYCWAIVALEAGNSTPSAMSTDSPTGLNCKKFDQSGPNTVTITVV